ncbi:conserved hypothetical protein [Leishmania braziliensis MHOM/BR/75/M2904]|uniref:Uncharacterized protein n=2 Tax=Leishmania braziliensis TaxID=5660 RepID=A4HM56_LEIBR|nr:conserved hypothetical protein [Leishmania braziliensis MHOM/BR/75/M2904]CAJ2479991.1 unnamed protein product [Leishmania braziliensis]CAM43238.1 conserved hypothetical protein [Leishmania braziliensis MHOM/BR/75/M2904]SYZ69313.1 hypothetical_protein [Leishmania braziliensis MHOM/BR/75/M2904]
MTGLDYAAKHGELERLVKRYCEHKKQQARSLHQQLREEVSTNVELRKYIAFLEGKLQAESKNAKQLGRLLDVRKNDIEDTLIDHKRHLDALTAGMESRLRMSERCERVCAELATSLEGRENQHCADANAFHTSKALLEAGLAASNKTVPTELQYSHDMEDSVTKLLNDVPVRNKFVLVQECDMNLKTSYTKHDTFLESDECAARTNLLDAERDERQSLLSSFFRASATYLNHLLAEQQERDTRLYRAEDLLRLQQMDLTNRMNKEMDLQQDRCVHAEMQQRVLALQCKSVLRIVGDALESLPGLDVEAVMLELESRVQGVLQLPNSNVSNECRTHKSER